MNVRSRPRNEPPPVQRILVGMDASSQAEPLLETAVQLAAHLRAELQVLFVEDEYLLEVGEIPFTREIRIFASEARTWDREHIQSQLRAKARQSEALLRQISTQHQIPHDFRIVRGRAIRELRTASGSADLVMVGRLRRSPIDRAPLDEATQNEILALDRPVLLYPPGTHLQLPALVLYHGTAASERSVGLAARLSEGAPHGRLTVLTLGRTDDGPRQPDRLGRLLRSFEVETSVQPVSNLNVPYLNHLLEVTGSGLVVAPIDLLEVEQLDLDDLLDELMCPLLLVPR